MLGAGAVGAAFLFGAEAAGAPRVELALYSEQDGPPPLLKNRSPLEALDAHAENEEPSLGVEYEDSVLLEDGDEGSMTVHEIASNAGTGPKGLARHPIVVVLEISTSAARHHIATQQILAAHAASPPMPLRD